MRKSYYLPLQYLKHFKRGVCAAGGVCVGGGGGAVSTLTLQEGAKFPLTYLCLVGSSTITL